MHIDRSTRTAKGKTYTRHLLRTSYRENGKVKHRTVANLSRCSEEEIAALRFALQNKTAIHDLLRQGAAILPEPAPAGPASGKDDAQKPAGKTAGKSPAETLAEVTVGQGQPVGDILLLNAVAERIGLADALGRDREGRLALWQVIARAIDQGSRLSAVRLAARRPVGALLGLDAFNENHLYSNLAWLAENQSSIEDRLFAATHAESPNLFLYDVTSTYIEGEHNELAAFGYNRDKKQGKRQIVVGLLTDGQGRPLALEAFRGNTNDTKTVASQLAKLGERFGAKRITLVGDRGMIRGPQIEQLKQKGFHYITAINKDQINSLISKGVIQMDLFDETLCEIQPTKPEEDGRARRYILRRNPVRAKEMERNRQERQQKLREQTDAANTRLAGHPRAKTATSLKKLQADAKKLKVDKWADIKVEGRTLNLAWRSDEIKEAGKLDGCYVIVTDLTAEEADKEMVHQRYKDLAEVERDFRDMKTLLEMRPVHVRRDDSTRGHLLVVMLAQRLTQELKKAWAEQDCTVAEGLLTLAGHTLTDLKIEGARRVDIVPDPNEAIAVLYRAAEVKVPKSLKPTKGKAVATKTKLTKRKKTR